ncbi:hypothetical protein [Clostridium sp.]|uniref:hypothetical protein n=1 Tax=Clostridium sp. TaxID=1506 RepID=UPI002846FEB9|nr:hypothetical protein [Clostridium sp.]MDR3598444.1 hypothetical protein [Clostridium sp.]
MVGKSDIESLREILNKLSENMDVLDEKGRQLLQKTSEEMDKLLLEYMTGNEGAEYEI